MKVTVEIKKFDPWRDFEKLMEVVESEGEEWSHYSSDLNRENYRKSLTESITYVAYSSSVLCGFSRSIDDFGFDLYVYDLLVHKSYRGKGIGRQLIECLSTDFPDQSIFVLSDVDRYYEKLGYKLEGSIFQVVSSGSTINRRSQGKT